MTRWLDDEEQRAWRSLIALTGRLQAALGHDLTEAHGLTEGDYGVLVHLSEAPERRLRMCDLAARLSLSPSGLTRRLDGMVKAGLVAREPASDDRRVTLAVLTDRGFAKLREAAPDHVESVRRHLLDHLSGPELRRLAALLDAVERRRVAAEAESLSRP